MQNRNREKLRERFKWWGKRFHRYCHQHYPAISAKMFTFLSLNKMQVTSEVILCHASYYCHSHDHDCPGPYHRCHDDHSVLCIQKSYQISCCNDKLDTLDLERVARRHLTDDDIRIFFIHPPDLETLSGSPSGLNFLLSNDSWSGSEWGAAVILDNLSQFKMKIIRTWTVASSSHYKLKYFPS